MNSQFYPVAGSPDEPSLLNANCAFSLGPSQHRLRD